MNKKQHQWVGWSVRGVVALGLYAYPMSGKAGNSYTGAISDFATACTAVVEQTKSAYKLVNDSVLQQKIYELANRGGDVDPRSILLPQISDENLKIRLELLEGLQAYSAALAELSGKTPGTLDTETKKLAASLGDLADNERLQHSFRETKDVTKEELNIAATGVKFLGDFLINRRISKGLPPKLSEAAPSVNKVIEVLAREIGGPPGDKDGSFRYIVWLAFNPPLDAEARVVEKEEARSQKRRDALARFAAVARDQKNAEEALANTRGALLKLAVAHDALLRINTSPATFPTIIAAVWAEAKDAQAFYATLPTK